MRQYDENEKNESQNLSEWWVFGSNFFNSDFGWGAKPSRPPPRGYPFLAGGVEKWEKTMPMQMPISMQMPGGTYPYVQKYIDEIKKPL